MLHQFLNQRLIKALLIGLFSLFVSQAHADLKSDIQKQMVNVSVKALAPRLKAKASPQRFSNWQELELESGDGWPMTLKFPTIDYIKIPGSDKTFEIRGSNGVALYCFSIYSFSTRTDAREYFNLIEEVYCSPDGSYMSYDAFELEGDDYVDASFISESGIYCKYRVIKNGKHVYLLKTLRELGEYDSHSCFVGSFQFSPF